MNRNKNNNSNNVHLSESNDVKDKQQDDKVLSTAAQIVFPVALLALLWGRRGLLAKLFFQFDKCCISVLCPSLSKRRRILKWASGRLSPAWSHGTSSSGDSRRHLLDEPLDLWRDGSLLCTLINSAVPGACNNPHRHWRKAPSHGQALAYKYLGVVPIFEDDELVSGSRFSLKSETLALQYLMDIQQAISRISVCETKNSTHYVVRGMGLVVGEQHRKTCFYIYPYKKSSDKQDVVVSLRGPYNAHNSATIPGKFASRSAVFKDLLGQTERHHLGQRSRSQELFFRSFSLDLGTLVYPDERDRNLIPLSVTSERDRVKVTFIPEHHGMYEIAIVAGGFHLLGSPFSVSVSESVDDVRDTFAPIDERQVVIADKTLSSSVKNIIKKKVISKIIDFVDEKIMFSKVEHGNGLSTPPEIKTEKMFKCDIQVEDYNNNNDEDDEVKELPQNSQDLYEETLAGHSSEEVEETDSCSSFDVNTQEDDDSRFSPVCPDHIVSEDDGVVPPPVFYRDQSSYPVEIFPSYPIPDVIVPQPKKRSFHKSNSMEILGLIGDLKTYESLSKSSKSNGSDYYSLRNRRFFELKTFPDALAFNFHSKLRYWESLIGLNANVENRTFSSHRGSLPNLLNTSLDFKSRFRRRHDYWESVSSGINTESIGQSSSNYRHLRRSLPDIRTVSTLKKLKKPQICNDDFKKIFRERRDYWERLSSTGQIDEIGSLSSLLSCKSYGRENDKSSLSAAVPDLLEKTFIEDRPERRDHVNLKDLYERRKNYWEKLAFVDSDIRQSSREKEEVFKLVNVKNVRNSFCPKVNSSNFEPERLAG